MIWILYLFMYIHNSLITVLWPSQLVQEFIQQQHFPSIFDPIASKHPSSVEFPSSMDQWFHLAKCTFMAHEMNTKVLSTPKTRVFKETSKWLKIKVCLDRSGEPGAQLHPNKSLMIHVSVPKLSNVQDKQTQTAKSPKSMLTSGVLLESVKHVGDGLSRMQLWEMSKLNNVM